MRPWRVGVRVRRKVGSAVGSVVDAVVVVEEEEVAIDGVRMGRRFLLVVCVGNMCGGRKKFKIVSLECGCEGGKEEVP